MPTNEELRQEGREAALEELEALEEAAKPTKVARTAVQAGSGGVLTALITYAVSFLPWDMAPQDPDSTLVPTGVVLAFSAAITVVAAYWMNRPSS